MHANPATNRPIDYRIVAGLSLLLSLWLIAIDPLINRDAIIYLRAADAYLDGGLLASQRLFERPLISICIAFIHQLTGIQLVHAGLLLSTLFYALFSVSFVMVVNTLGGDRRVQWFAAIVVLSHPMLNDHRSSIMRDPAYWAFSLLAFRELLLFARQPGLRHQIGWYVFILLAALFRFEGLFFIVLAPLTLLATHNTPNRLRRCLQLLIPQILLTAALLLGLGYYLQSGSAGKSILPALGRYLDRLFALPLEFPQVATATGEALLRYPSQGDAAVAATAGLAAILLVSIARAITWPYVFVLIWGRLANGAARLRSDDNRLLRLHIVITLGYLCLFTLINRFMIDRYSKQLAIFALLYLPFVLNLLWYKLKPVSGRAIVIVLLVLMTLDTLHNGDYKKAFIGDANQWLLENTDTQDRLVTNIVYVAYFSERDFNWKNLAIFKAGPQQLITAPQWWRTSDYLAIRVRPRHAEDWARFLETFQLEESASFEGKRYGRVAIVKIPEQFKSARPSTDR